MFQELNGKIKVHKGQPVNSSLKLGDIIDYFEAGKILPRKDNRGKIGMKPEKIRDICKNLHPPSLFTIIVSQETDNSYELVDSHTRIAGILARKKEVGLTKEEANYEWSIQVCHPHDKDEIYTRVNSQIPHNGAVKLTDPTRLLGYHGIKMQELAGVQLRPSFQSVFWDFIIGKKNHDGLPQRIAASRARTEITVTGGLQDRPAEANGLILGEKIRTKTKNALMYYGKVVNTIENVAETFPKGGLKKNILDLTKQAGLLTVILADGLEDEPLLQEITPTKLADNMIRNALEVKECFLSIAKRHSVTLKEVEATFKNLGLKGKKLNEAVIRYFGEAKD